MASQFASRRSTELQKRLERRNISLKPADFCTNGKRNLLLTADNNVHHSLFPEYRSTDPSPSSTKEGFQETQKVGQESQENSPELANTGKEGQLEGVLDKQKAAASEIVEGALQRILQTHPTTTATTITSFKMRESYLPVATSARRGSRASKKISSYRVADAEQEYNRMFNAPSLIEVHQKALSDDAVTEVSEITTDIRTRSLRGASYAERRMAGKLQKLREQGFSTMAQPAGFRLPGHAEGDELQQSDSYVEGDVGHLKDLMQKVEQAKQNLQQSGPVLRRHGLPYEASDFRSEGDDEYSVDPWDGAIRGTNMRIPSPRREVVDPEDGEVLCVRGPPTPRNRSCPERLHHLIRETISSEGEIVIDATEVCDEDLDVVTDVTDSKHHRIRTSDSKTVGTSVLLGEDIIDAEDPTLASETDVKQPTKRDFAEAVLESEARDPVSVTRDNKATTAGIVSISDYDSGLRVGEDDAASILVQADVRKEEDFASEIISTSIGFFKSFAAQVNTQLKNIQSKGLISEHDMDGMLGVLERDMNEASAKIPKESGEIVLVFGEELEKNTCGAQEAMVPSKAMLPEPSRDLVISQTSNVENVLDSLKASYKSGFTQCGVDQNLVKENTKAIEEMVSNLKNAYHSNAPTCGGAPQDDVFVTTALQINNVDKEGTAAATSKTITVMNDAAIKSRSLAQLVKQMQEAKKKQIQQKGVDTPGLKQESSEAVEEMLRKAREACRHKTVRIGKLKKNRTKPASGQKAPGPQTFIVPINMPKRTSVTSSSVSTSTGQQEQRQPVAKGYSAIE
jgi:hypothetical protein